MIHRMQKNSLGSRSAGEAPDKPGNGGSPEATDDSHGQIKIDQHMRTESGFAENVEPLFFYTEKSLYLTPKKHGIFVSDAILSNF